MIAFICDDVGPATYCSEIIKLLTDSDCVYVGSKKSCSVFHATSAAPITLSEIIHADLIVTGTTLSDLCLSQDKQALIIGRDNNIPTIAIIEHWTNFSARFVSLPQQFFPDLVLVNDAIAHKLALDAGYPRNRLMTLGNPVLEKLEIQRQILTPSSIIKRRLGFKECTEVFVFISESLRRINHQGAWPERGYDEYQVLESILDVLEESVDVVIKLHPEEDPRKYKKYVSNRLRVERHLTALEVASMADVIIGMESMFMIELAYLSNRVVSFIPSDHSSSVSLLLSFVPVVSSSSQLKEFIKSDVAKDCSYTPRFFGSARDICSLLIEMQKK